jgi:hypothetical protein
MKKPWYNMLNVRTFSSLHLFEKASNSGCQSCSILLLSINERLVASEQNLQNLFHGQPGRRQNTCTNDSKFEDTTHFIQVTEFLHLLIQGINYRPAFLKLSPCPFSKGCVFITITSFSSSCKLQKDNPKAINVNLLIDSCRASILYSSSSSRQKINKIKIMPMEKGDKPTS